MWHVSVLVSYVFYLYHDLFPEISIKIDKNCIFRAREKFLQRFRSFSVKWLRKLQELAVSNDIKHFL